jgi:hypothetical protein
LYEADRLAHQEAIRNGGVITFLYLSVHPLKMSSQLILYWYGIPNPDTGMNLATCVWQSRKHAIAAHSRPYHIQAMKLAAESFEMYTLERHMLRKVKGEKGITVEEFCGGDVGW